jgi:hypothetical protein
MTEHINIPKSCCCFTHVLVVPLFRSLASPAEKNDGSKATTTFHAIKGADATVILGPLRRDAAGHVLGLQEHGPHTIV